MENVLVRAVVGLAVLLFGRRLFWLFVGAAGFLVGILVTPSLLGPNQPGWLPLVVALVLGVVGALLAIFLQRLMVVIAGFVALGSVAVAVLPLLGLDPGGTGRTIVFIVAGIVGAIIAAVTFDLALIVLSSLAGAQLVATAAQGYFSLTAQVTLVVLVVLWVIGVAVQTRTMERARPAPRPMGST